MQKYVERSITEDVRADLARVPIVALLGPPRCGKTLLAKKIAESYPSALYLNLEKPRDRAKLADPQRFAETNANAFVCIDQVQSMDELVPLLCAVIAVNTCPGRFLLASSLSREAFEKGTESLSGRIAYRELSPFFPSEYLKGTGTEQAMLELISRGGFPESAMAVDAVASLTWREAYLRKIEDGDVHAMKRFLKKCARLQGQPLDVPLLAQSLGQPNSAVRDRLDALQKARLIRLLPAWEGATDKRLIRDRPSCISATQVSATRF